MYTIINNMSEEKKIVEGKVKVATDVSFYNETQVFNRDLSVLAVETFLDGRVAKHAEML